MEERICPVCLEPVYSAATEQEWTCSHCGATIPKLQKKFKMEQEDNGYQD